MKVTVKNLQKRITINPAQVKRIAERIENSAKFKDLSLSLYFVENSEIVRLNNQFFQKDSLTDVISFNLSKRCAEVFIAPLVVRENANDYSVDFNEELLRCVIHGILHVFGYRDSTKKEKKIMWAKQEKLLRELSH